MKYFLDTNIFIRVLELENKKVFNECCKVLDLVKNSKIKAYTSSTVLSEIVWVLGSSYDESREKILKGLSSILKLNNLKIVDNYDLSKALELYSDFSVKFIDALIASNPDIQAKKMVVVSYDKDFDKLKVKRLEPVDLIKPI